MTVSTTTTYNEATGAGGVKVFYFTFRCDDSSWVKVYLDGVFQGSGYTVALNSDQSASPGGIGDVHDGAGRQGCPHPAGDAEDAGHGVHGLRRLPGRVARAGARQGRR